MPFTYPSGGSNARYEPTGERRNGRPLYCVLDDFRYETAVNGTRVWVFVDAGFVTDLASIPSLPFMPRPGGSLWDDAAIIHDRALGIAGATNIPTWWVADAIFYNALLERGCTRFTAWVFWAAVRLRSLVR